MDACTDMRKCYYISSCSHDGKKGIGANECIDGGNYAGQDRMSQNDLTSIKVGELGP